MIVSRCVLHPLSASQDGADFASRDTKILLMMMIILMVMMLLYSMIIRRGKSGERGLGYNEIIGKHRVTMTQLMIENNIIGAESDMR